MTAIVQAQPESDRGAGAPAPTLLVEVAVEHGACVVHVSGELDAATRSQLVSAATAGRAPAMVIDLGGVTFMDCTGYGSLVAARVLIEGDGRALSIVGRVGQPARLWKLIAELGAEVGADETVTEQTTPSPAPLPRSRPRTADIDDAIARFQECGDREALETVMVTYDWLLMRAALDDLRERAAVR